MFNIYKILNTLTGEVYIGKTSKTIEERWQQHVWEAAKDRSQHLPLYYAIRKYDNALFESSIIERVADELTACERESYWIEQYRSTEYGYNVALGGAGRPMINREAVLALFNAGMNLREIAGELGTCCDQISTILKKCDIKSSEIRRRGNEKNPVNQLDVKTGVVLATYSSIVSAKEALGVTGSHISCVCRGKRKSAHGYSWEYANLSG